MKRLPLIFMVLLLCISQVFTQTKTKTVANKTKVTTPKEAITKSASTPVNSNPVSTATPTKPNIPAGNPADLTGLEAEIFAEINKMRKNPAEYAKIFEDYLRTNSGKSFKFEGVEYETNEGKTPVEELIATLKQTSSLPEFKALDGLTKAAKDHAQDLAKNNLSGHRGTDQSLPDERVARYGTAFQVNENISYYTKTARRVVMTMLIDDGNSNRNHRKNLLSTNLKFVGIATGVNKTVENFCIIVLTDTFVDKKGGIRSF